jgi:hypothetical protein
MALPLATQLREDRRLGCILAVMAGLVAHVGFTGLAALIDAPQTSLRSLRRLDCVAGHDE